MRANCAHTSPLASQTAGCRSGPAPPLSPQWPDNRRWRCRCWAPPRARAPVRAAATFRRIALRRLLPLRDEGVINSIGEPAARRCRRETAIGRRLAGWTADGSGHFITGGHARHRRQQSGRRAEEQRLRGFARSAGRFRNGAATPALRCHPCFHRPVWCTAGPAGRCRRCQSRATAVARAPRRRGDRRGDRAALAVVARDTLTGAAAARSNARLGPVDNGRERSRTRRGGR